MQTIKSKIEKVPRGIRGEKSSKDMASSRNLVSTIGALACPAPSTKDCWRNRTQEKSYPREIVPVYDFTRDIVPRVRFLQRYRTLGTKF